MTDSSGPRERGSAMIPDLREKLEHNLNQVRENIAEASLRRGRNTSDVHLVAVTKSVDAVVIRALLELGHAEMGESRVQELLQRSAMIRESIQRRIVLPGFAPENKPTRPIWHMIGHLQRNKVKQLLPIVKYIHSVDSLRLAEEINTAAARLGMNEKVNIFLQVNTSKEPQKYGMAVGAVTAMAEQVVTLPNVQVVGLMTMAPLTQDPENCRFCFARLKELFEELRGEKICGPAFQHLSMGMSQDYEVAVEEGATMVRVGSALFEGISRE